MAVKKSKSGTVPVSVDEEQRKRAAAMVALDPVFGNATTVVSFASKIFGPVDEIAAFSELQKRVKAVESGDLTSAEAMLTGQAAALNAMFLELARRGGVNMGANLEVMEAYMRLALKAQSQCRSTLETLTALKNPPVVYARQANFSNGPQQVNNGARAHAGEAKKTPNKLLEVGGDEGERLDFGTPGQAIGRDQAMAAVGAVDRPKI